MKRKIKKDASEYSFKSMKQVNDKLLICPKCFEILFRDDIEHFGKCSFCDSSLEMNMELEDYLLKPVVDKWIWRENLVEGRYMHERVGQSFSEKYLY